MSGVQRDHVLAAGGDHPLSQRILEIGIEIAHLILQPHTFGDLGGKGLDAGVEHVEGIVILGQITLQPAHQAHGIEYIHAVGNEREPQVQKDKAQKQHGKHACDNAVQLLGILHDMFLSDKFLY